MNEHTTEPVGQLSKAGQAAACEQVLERVFDASVDLVRALKEPANAESLIRASVTELDDCIRLLRTVVDELWNEAGGPLSLP